MCGIGGILKVQSPGAVVPPVEDSIPEAWLDVLDESIRHRGPDGKGRFRDRVVRQDGSVVDVALVHRRLSIIDLACGAQPMVSGGWGSASMPVERARSASEGLDDRSSVDQTFQGVTLPVLFHGRPDDEVAYQGLIPQGMASEDGTPNPSLALRARQDRANRGRGGSGDQLGSGDGRIAVVFNGCIYNHRELRQELESLGHVFETDHSDTEVLIHGWRAWGNNLKDRLDSMHAFAIWDAANAKLVLCRDRFGEKPLYISMVPTGHLWVFASVPWAIPRIAGLEAGRRLALPAIELDAARIWTAFGYDDCLTPYEEVVQVPVGSMISAPATEKKALKPERVGKGGLRRSLTFRKKATAVELVDRAITEAVESRLEADVPLGCFLSGGIDSSLVARAAAAKVPRLRTISVRMPDERYDESRYAQIVADIIGSDHLVVDCDPRPAEDLEMLIHTLGLPFGDSSLLPTFWASAAAREHVKVVLTGDGGDELFLGYDRYGPAEWINVLAITKYAPVHLLLGSSDPRSRSARAARLLEAAGGTGYIDLVAIFPYRLQKKLFMSGVAGAWMTPHSRLQAQDFDLKHHLPGDMLRKVDTASMMVDLEVRAPLLSRRVADEALKLPAHILRLNRQRKGLLRAVARRYFPPEIVDRPKMGFAIPIGEWFRSDYGGMRQMLLDHLTSVEPFGPAYLGIDGMINTAYVRRLLKEHDNAGERSPWPWKGRDHSQRLYMLLVLSIWAKWLDGLKRDRAENV